MNKIIDVDIVNEEALYETYNTKKVSHNLINYIIESALSLEKKEIKKIIINNYTKEEAKELISDGLKDAYVKSFKRHRFLNNMQIIYLLIGIISISLSLLIDYEIIEEVVLIGGWVFVWEAIELEITSDINEMRRRKILEKLLQCDIEEKIIKD